MSVGSYITQGHVAEELRLRLDRRRQPARLLLARPARGRRLQAEHRRAGLRDLDDADLAAGRPRCGHLRAAARLLDVQRHVDGVAAGGRRGSAADQRRQAAERAEAAGAAAAGDQLVRPLPRSARFGAYEQGNGLIERRRRLGPAEDEHQDRRRSPRRCRSTRCSPASSRRRTSARGIHDREGVTPARATRATYTFTRTTGGGGSTTYNVTWVGNDGTFSSRGLDLAARRARRRRSP